MPYAAETKKSYRFPGAIHPVRAFINPGRNSRFFITEDSPYAVCIWEEGFQEHLQQDKAFLVVLCIELRHYVLLWMFPCPELEAKIPEKRDFPERECTLGNRKNHPPKELKELLREWQAWKQSLQATRPTEKVNSEKATLLHILSNKKKFLLLKGALLPRAGGELLEISSGQQKSRVPGLP